MTEKKTWWEKYNLFVSILFSTLMIVFTILASWWNVLGGINDNRTAIVRNGERIMQNGESIMQNGENIMQNGERITQNGERITQNGERVTQNGERITQNGERIIQNGEKIDSFRDFHQREHDIFYELPANSEKR